MWLKKKDKVVVLSGSEKGKRGEVLRPSGKERFVISKINIVKRHTKATRDESGGIIEKEAPMHQSKIMLVCPQCDSGTRPKINILQDGTKVRVCRNCSETIQ